MESTRVHSITSRECLAQAAIDLVESCLPVVLLQHGRKAPLASDDGSWLVIDDPEAVLQALDRFPQSPNLGVLLAPKGGSKVVVIDVDDKTRTAKLRDLGVNSADPIWLAETGKGGLHVYYYAEAPPPQRVIRADGLPIDLLSDGFAVVPPSNTSLEPKGGGPYRWVPGHGPREIPLAELQPIPQPLLAWWNGCACKRSVEPSYATNNGKTTAWHLLTDPIPEGMRNAVLTRIAGWLRLYHPIPVVVEILLAVNDARCRPPLSGREVEAIVRSVSKYPQPGVNGHPRALVNPWQTEATR